MFMCNRCAPSDRRGSAPSAEEGDTRETVEVPFFHPGLSVASSLFARTTGTSGSAVGTAESLRNGRLKVSCSLNPVAMERRWKGESLVWCSDDLSSVALGLFGLHEHLQVREPVDSLEEPSSVLLPGLSV